MNLLRGVWREIHRDYRSEFAYLRALDNVWDSLDLNNPCHDEVRLTIKRLRHAMTEGCADDA